MKKKIVCFLLFLFVGCAFWACNIGEDALTNTANDSENLQEGVDESVKEESSTNDEVNLYDEMVGAWVGVEDSSQIMVFNEDLTCYILFVGRGEVEDYFYEFSSYIEAGEFIKGTFQIIDNQIVVSGTDEEGGTYDGEAVFYTVSGNNLILEVEGDIVFERLTEITDSSHSIVGKWSVYATEYFDLNMGTYGTGNTITFYNDGTYKVDDKRGNGTYAIVYDGEGLKLDPNVIEYSGKTYDIKMLGCGVMILDGRWRYLLYCNNQ